MNATESVPDVLVVGAGPVGLLIALRLAQSDVSVIVLEALSAIEASPRAMAYQPVAVKELDRAGILEDARMIGGRGRAVCWRKTRNGEIIAKLERDITPEHPYENLVIGQHELAAIILEKLERVPCAKVLWNHRVMDVTQSDGTVGAEVMAEAPDGAIKSLRAQYVVGADGGKSSVRRLCNIGFEGFTWPQQVVATNVYYPFDKYGWEDANFLVDPDHWALIAKIDAEGLWRVSYGEQDGLTEAQLRGRLPMKFDRMFPGPRPLEYKLDQFSPYRIHQRCANTFRKGRVLLAGDAAHLCNPFGGLGLTGGLLDAAALADTLIDVLKSGAADTALTTYATVRRDVFLDVVNPTSQANKIRLHETNPDTVGETDDFLRGMREADQKKKQDIRAHRSLAAGTGSFVRDEMRT